jgi:hypothetical protein
MKEEQNNTKTLKQSANKLEQLPSSKKRSLNTDLLATPLTHKLDEAAAKNYEATLTPATKEFKAVEETPNTALTMSLDNSPTSETPKETAPLSSLTNTSRSVKEAQGKSSKESPKEVVQEILKEVAKEVEKEKSVKATSSTTNTPVSASKEFKAEKTEKIEMKKAPKEPNGENSLFSKAPSISTTPLTKEEPAIKESPEEKKLSWAEQPLESKEPKTKDKENKEAKAENKNDEKSSEIKIKKVSEQLENNSLQNKTPENEPAQIEMPLFNSINQFSAPPPEVKTTGAKIKSLVLWSIPFFILLGASIGVIYAVPALREKVAQKLPYNVASALKLTTEQISTVSLQEYTYSIDEADKTVKMKGIVKNLSKDVIGSLELEFELTKRGDENSKDIKKVPLNPTQLEPNQEGQYEFVFSATDYQVSKFSKIVSSNGIKINTKKLGLINPPVDPTQAPSLEIPNTKPKKSDDTVYEGSVN